MNKVIKILGVPRSTVFYKTKAYPKRKSTIRKELPVEVISAIKEITSKKSTYGVPRVKSILKRDYGIDITKHLLHRHLKEEGLLIKRNRSRGPGRDHSGKIEVAISNTRWASDITSIKC